MPSFSFPSLSHFRHAARLTLAMAGAALLNAGGASSAHAHGSLENGRMLQVRLAGPNGHTPALWNESYYTWNQNSRNFPTYASPGFSYSQSVPDGKISNAGINDGVQSTLDFSGLNNPGANWGKTAVSAGSSVPLHWLATALHDPSYFEVFLTQQGFDVATLPLGWSNLEYVGRWAVGSATKTVTTGTRPNPVGGTIPSYSWNVPIPADRAGNHTIVVIWQRQDPAGEAFFATIDLNVAAAAVPATLGVQIQPGGAALVQLRGAANQAYNIEVSDDLATNRWTVLGTGTTSAAGKLEITDSAAAGYARRFYRGVSVAP